MRRRTPAEVGAIIKRRRELLQVTQDGIDGVASATVRKIEAGTAGQVRESTMVALAKGLRWPVGFVEALYEGADPDTLATVDHGAQLSAAPTLADVVQRLDVIISILTSGADGLREGSAALAERMLAVDQANREMTELVADLVERLNPDD